MQRRINSAYIHFNVLHQHSELHYGGRVQTNKQTKELLANRIVRDSTTLCCNYPVVSHLSRTAPPDERLLNSNSESGSAPGIDNAICSLNQSGWMLINSAEPSGLYSHPWPLLMNIDLDLSGPKSRARRAMVSEAGKQNSHRINMARWGRVCVFISLTPACSIIMRIKGKQTAAETGSRQLSRPWHTCKQCGQLCLVFSFDSVNFLPYLPEMDTNAVTVGACQ